MEKLVWDEKFNIGVDVIDKAHAKLFRIINRLLDISEADNNYQHTYKEGVKYLEAYSMKHFSEEETYMRSIKYKGYAHHKKMHDNFRDKTLISLKKDLELSHYSTAAVERFVKVMNNWLQEHIMREDQAIVGRIFPPKDQTPSRISVIARGVNRATTEVLQAELRLVNPDYKGRNIGKGFYARRCYEVEGGIKLQMLLGVEDTLVARGINRLPKRGKDTKEDLILVFDRLFESLSKLFRAEPDEEMTKENLLTLENFRTEFMKGYPCSLLFSNRVGHLAFCYRTWKVKSQKNEEKETKHTAEN